MYNNTARLECTDAQWSYLRRLMTEAFVHHCASPDLPNLDVHHMPTYYTKTQASQDIETLKRLKMNGWKRD